MLDPTPTTGNGKHAMYDHDHCTDIDIDDGSGCITAPAVFSTWITHDDDLPSLTLETVSLGKHKLNREAMCDWLGAAAVARIEAAYVPERWAPERRMEAAE